jgi:hypothetical protein
MVASKQGSDKAPYVNFAGLDFALLAATQARNPTELLRQPAPGVIACPGGRLS